MSTAKIARDRLIYVLADDHGRGTRSLTMRDVTWKALEMFTGSDPFWNRYAGKSIPDMVGGTIRFKPVDATVTKA